MIQDIAIVGFIGMVLQMLMKAKSIQDKARLSNVQFQFWRYFTDDWLSHLISSLAIILFIYLVKNRVANLPEKTAESLHEFILGTSATVGYAGADIVSRFFSFTNKRINAAIDFKTTQADTAAGTLNTPTPATSPKH